MGREGCRAEAKATRNHVSPSHIAPNFGASLQSIYRDLNVRVLFVVVPDEVQSRDRVAAECWK